MRTVYMVHSCKNSKLEIEDPLYCNNGWIDEDKKGGITVPTWKYCEKCILEYGFINPEKPPKKKMSQKQIEVLERNKFMRKNSSNLKVINVNNIKQTGGKENV